MRSVDQAFDAHADWPAVTDHFAKDAEIALSNVGDRGYDVADEDRVFDPASAKIPVSFPGKLLALLGARHRAGGRPLLFLPTELIASNGRILSRLVADLARVWGMSAAFQEWLAGSVVFADGLVDRIVSEDIEPIGAVAEPYALWAIRRGNFDPPFTHPAIVMTDNLEPFERLKLHILNLGHTVLAEEWTRHGRPADETVARFLSDAAIAQRLTEIYASEVVPGFAARGMKRRRGCVRANNAGAVPQSVPPAPYRGYRQQPRHQGGAPHPGVHGLGARTRPQPAHAASGGDRAGLPMTACRSSPGRARLAGAHAPAFFCADRLRRR